MQLPTNTPQYFFDETWIASSRYLKRRWLSTNVHPDPALVPDRPWEANELVLFGTVVRHGDEWWMYYSRRDSTNHMVMLLATSTDGIRWWKPELGIVEWGGSTANNIVLNPPRKADSFSVVFDDRDAEFPWKCLGSMHGDNESGWGLFAWKSRDGLRWEELPGRRLPTGDRTNAMFERVDGKFIAWTRHPDMMKRGAGRVAYRSESEDFLTWTEPVEVIASDLDDEPVAEIYGMSAFRRNGWFFGLVEFWHSVPDVIETTLAISRDGYAWRRPVPRTPFIAATYDWNKAWTSCASNGPIIIDGQMVFYFNGRQYAHGSAYPERHGVIGMATMPVDRFCALEGIAGSFETPAFAWPGGDLFLNHDAREHFEAHQYNTPGRVRVEVLDPSGAPVADWSGEDAASLTGNTKKGSVKCAWPDSRPLGAMRGRDIRLKFTLERARLFTFEARV
jgi:hypothetical protein